MTVANILVRLQIQTGPGSATGTTDALYLGVITRHGGREFPLRYTKTGLVLGSGQSYEFGIGNPDLPADKQIYQSSAGQPNSLDAYPLTQVERVYLRKAAVHAGKDNDDTLGVEYIGVFVTENSVTVDWSNRNRPDSSGPSPFWLGNEFGQTVYLNPE